MKTNLSFKTDEVKHVNYFFQLRDGRMQGVAQVTDPKEILQFVQIKDNEIKKREKKIKSLHRKFERLK